MSETANSDGTSAESEKKPAILARLLNDEVKFPPFPDPTEEEFEEDIGDDERTYYRNKFTDLNTVTTMRLHCTACDRHLGSSTRNESRMRAHPMLRTVVCQSCHTFYNSGEFEKGDDGSELYCRWCGQGGQVYCCSDCPHVFCAKCIKRNLGAAKIKEIENTDDWKCFKCNSKCLWDLRAVCWALLRYCDLKNKITYKTEDPALKEVYQKDCAEDYTECCKHKASRKKEKLDTSKKKEEPKKKEELKKKEEPKKSAASVIIPKLSSAIQVKKFASINIEEPVKKATKRPANDNKVVMMRNPISIAPPKAMGPIAIPPPHKKPRMPMVNPIRYVQDRKPMNTYQRIRPKMNLMPSMPIPIMPHQFNGFNNNAFNSYGNMDTLNLSLESLTQGLDMVAVAAMNNSVQDDDVVCTPDFPLEPLCEVTEDNTDDDVQCITPAAGPPPLPPLHPLPPAVSRLDNSLPDISPDNIVQMTDNDVTVNALTGGLKFRVDPQTLSSNKMYRLPDGRIFAIKANPNMPGGYSATIVAVTETGQAKVAPKGATYAAKLSAVSSSQTSTPKPGPSNASPASRPGLGAKRSTPKHSKITRIIETPSRECDLQVPIEWFRYNLVDAVDALEYSLHRLYKLKKEANCRFLRSRSIDEMRILHRSLDRLLNTSSTRFNEIKDNLSKDFKQFLSKKTGETLSDDDDDVEILADNIEENDDPIFIDENSLESSNDLTCTEPENPEVDLTGVGSSDHNDSGENKSEDVSKIDKDEIADVSVSPNTENSKVLADSTMNDSDKLKEIQDKEVESSDQDSKNETVKHTAETKVARNSETDQENATVDSETDKINYVLDKASDKNEDNNEKDNDESENLEKDTKETEIEEKTKVNGDTEQDKSNNDTNNDENFGNDEKLILADDISNQDNGKLEDAEMSEEMIETLLKDDNVDDIDTLLNKKASEVVEGL